MQDIIIIGAGIIGSFLANDLAHYDLKVLVIDKENDVANETSMANSAIIHTGYDPKEGTLKAKLNVEGAKMYPKLWSRMNLDHNVCGAYVVAKDEEEILILNELYERAKKRDIICERLQKSDIDEKNISDNILQAISFPTTAIIYPWQCAKALLSEAILNGVTLSLGEKVIGIKYDVDHFIVSTNKTIYTSRIVINAAGIYCDDIASLLTTPKYTITPKKGEYMVLSKNVKDYVKHIIFPVPSKKGKGVLALPTTHGNVLLGPTSIVVEKGNVKTTVEGLNEIKNKLTSTMKNIPYQEVIRTYAGLRACGNNGDFYIKADDNYPNFIHVACIDSPGLASAPAISKYVIETIIMNKLALIKKQKYVEYCLPPKINNLTILEKNSLIKQHPLYGKIVCKCEKISYQEIVDAIHDIIPCKTLKSIKKQVRPGMGKCQGGFCEVEVAKILATELKIPLNEVLYDSNESKLGKVAK